MAKYNVCFTKYYSYVVEADDENEAFDLAFEDGFDLDMHSCVADCSYDNVEIEEVKE